MSDAKLTCNYDHGWGYRCPTEVKEVGQLCEKHTDQRCSTCGKPAARDCDVTVGPLCCGRPLCNGCRCTWNHGW